MIYPIIKSIQDVFRLFITTYTDGEIFLLFDTGLDGVMIYLCILKRCAMSRFGLRKKIKNMLFGTSSNTYETFHITYILPNGEEQVVEAEERYTVLMASQSLPSPISTGRRAGGNCPDGQCGSCRIEVADATGLSEKQEMEQSILDAVAQGLPHEGRCREVGSPQTPNTRLACHVRIIGSGARIVVPELVNYENLKGDENGT